MAIKNKVAMVTAAASGIGRQVAEAFAAEGAKLIISDIDGEKIETFGQELQSKGVDVVAMKCNVGNLEEIDQLFDSGLSRFKTLDILVNMVGIEGPTAPVTTIDPKVWDDVMAVNVRSMFYMIQKASPYMMDQQSGKIVNFSSTAGKAPLAYRSPYCASKMAVIGLTRCVATELGQYNITANTICPAMVEGERFFGVMKKQAEAHNIPFEVMKQKGAETLPLKRYVKANHVVDMVMYLSYDEKSGSITAQDFNVDCGSCVH